jgi:hypothetical protein
VEAVSLQSRAEGRRGLGDGSSGTSGAGVRHHQHHTEPGGVVSDSLHLPHSRFVLAYVISRWRVRSHIRHLQAEDLYSHTYIRSHSVCRIRSSTRSPVSTPAKDASRTHTHCGSQGWCTPSGACSNGSSSVMHSTFFSAPPPHPAADCTGARSLLAPLLPSVPGQPADRRRRPASP